MKQLHNPHRSALTAIAAVLVLGSTPAIAQQLPAGSEAGTQAPVAAAPAVPVAAPEIVIPGSQPAATPLPSTNSAVAPITVAPPIVQPAPVISAAPVLAAEPAPAERVADPAPRAAPRAAEAETPTVTARAPTPQAAPTTTPAEGAAEPMPGIAPSELMVMEQGESAPPVAETPPAPADSAIADDGNMWAIIGGTGAVLLLGGAAYALNRRRKTVSGAFAATRYEPETTRVNAPQERQPAAFSAPQFARSRQPTPVDGSDLEAMAAAAPTAENPFLTRRNRLRRANFLLHRGERATIAPQHEAVKAPSVATASQAQTQRSAQPVYSFGKAPVTYRPAGWKPSTS